MNGEIGFEFNVPVFAGAPEEGDEPVHRDTPWLEGSDWAQTKESVLLAEELGSDAAWVPDHLMLGRDNAEYECWTLLSAIAGFTDEIEYSWDGHVICTRDEEILEELIDLKTPIQFEQEYQDRAPIETVEDACEYFVLGTPEECAEAIKERIDVGVTKFQVRFVDFPETGGMELFADDVIPQFA